MWLKIFAILLLVGLLAATPVNQPPAQNGRYQIVINPNVREDTFLVDTQDGKVYRMTKITDVEGQPHIWKYEPRWEAR